jgi:tetratricopeptide (TPR) repeat protein
VKSGRASHPQRHLQDELVQDALTEYRRSRDLDARLVKAHPGVPQYEGDLARTHHNLGTVLVALGKGQEALNAYRLAGEVRARLIQAQPSVAQDQLEQGATYLNRGNRQAGLGKHQEALAELEKARDLFGRLVQDYPGMPSYVECLARLSLVRGWLLGQMNRLGESVADLYQSISLVNKVLRLDPSNSQGQGLLVLGLTERAIVRARLGRPAEADADRDRVLALAPADRLLQLRLRRAEIRARTGDYLRAATEADKLERLPSLTGPSLYSLAAIQALTAASATRDGQCPLPLREHRAGQYALAAIALLRRAAAVAHFRNPSQLDYLDRDPDLAFLRQRADYQDFRRQLPPRRERK